jgi:pectate lyase
MLTSRLASAIVALAGSLAVARADDSCGGPAYTLEGYGASTTGGSGPETVVKTCDQLREAAKKSGVIVVEGWINGCGIINVQSDTTVIGQKNYLGGLNEASLNLVNVDNVVVRNLAFQHAPLGANNILLDGATNVWIDHLEFYSSTPSEGKYGSQLFIKPNSDLITVSWNMFFGPLGAVEVAEADGEKKPERSTDGETRISFHHNFWSTIGRRAPTIQAGSAHIYSNCFQSVRESGIAIETGSSALVENNYFAWVNDAISTNGGSATERDNEYYESPFSITNKGHVEPPYEYTRRNASCICDLLCDTIGRFM